MIGGDGQCSERERRAARPVGEPEVAAALGGIIAPDLLADRHDFVAGVGTPFVDEIGDQGVGLQAAAGAATGWAGEGRINWALLQIHNVVHAHAFGNSLSAALGKSDKELAKAVSVDLNFKGIDLGGTPPKPGSLGDINARGSSSVGALKLMAAEQNGIELTWDRDTIWAQLKGEVDTANWTATMRAWDEKRRVALRARCAQLKARVGDLLVKGKPKLQRIRLYVFGFSRGAAEARTFSNWLADALDPDFSLCGVPVSYDFLGIFDTVASVGIAQSTAATLFDGHGGWGREQSGGLCAGVRLSCTARAGVARTAARAAAVRVSVAGQRLSAR